MARAKNEKTDMKKIFWAAILPIMVAMTACEKNDSTGSAEKEDTTDYLCLTAQEAGSTISVNFQATQRVEQNQPTVPILGSDYKTDIEYSLDKKTWSKVDATTIITLAKVGDKAYFRGHNPERFSYLVMHNDVFIEYFSTRFCLTGRIAASGNIMTLVDGTGKTDTIPSISNDSVRSQYFSSLFYENEALTQAPELPAMHLSPYCYQDMFSKCTSLEKAPDLPATVLANDCYGLMFAGCTSLEKAPEVLPAKIVEYQSYMGMFMGCTSLKKSPEIQADSIVDTGMNQMFMGCTSLESVSDFKFRNIGIFSCNGMFANCTSLVKAPAMDNVRSVGYSGCYSMYLGCTALTQAPALPAMDLSTRSYASMFEGCTSLEEGPVLPAIDLGVYSYERMFYGCSKLRFVGILTDLTTDQISMLYGGRYIVTDNWLYGVAEHGTIRKLSTWDLTGPSGVPEGWTVELAD